MTILKVAVFTPLRQLFDYLPPPSTQTLAPGLRVKVPFGKQTCVAIINEITSTSTLPISRLKPICEILDDKPLFQPDHIKLIQWASQYYLCPIGEVFETALPPKLRTTSKIQTIDTKEAISEAINDRTPPYTLNDEQSYAINTICKHFNSFKPFLLEGVTGSGKTEVYLTVVERLLQQDKTAQVLILVPEIGLTPQIYERFKERFQDRFQNTSIALIHSSLSENKRLQAWLDSENGQANIIIGTRSAAFVPIRNLKLLIIDEEHDLSFKQQEGFRYSGRDVLVKRASLQQCPIILGSATPSLETLQNAQNGRYQKLRLKERAGLAKPPIIQVLDIRHKKLKSGLSAQLISKIRTHLEEQKQVLIFLNRRGFAPVEMCFDCGFIAKCKYCDAKMIVHFHNQTLQCHHCEKKIPIYKQCPSCQSSRILPLGIGTERIEQTLQEEFKDVPMIRLDKDTTRKKNAMQSAITDILSGKTKLILGTQMIAKGHHFPNVSLVAIIDIDSALFSTDFRSIERMGQLFMQVAGRAGRASTTGEVILQTCHPHHPLIKQLIDNGYSHFAENLLCERKSIHLPPFSHQALIRAESKHLEKALQFLSNIKMNVLHLEHSNKIAPIQILGPSSAPLEKRRGNFHAQLLLQSNKRNELHVALNESLNFINNPNNKQNNVGIRFSIDVDPQEMF